MSQDKPAVNPGLAAALPSVPENQFWRVTEVFETDKIIHNLWKKSPTLLEKARNVLPKRNPNRLRLELREVIEGKLIRNVQGLLEVDINLSRVLRNTIVEVDGMREEEIVQSLTVEAQRILREMRTAETGRERANHFKGDYR